MGQLSDKDLLAIHQLAPMWHSIQPLWWQNPLGYRLELVSQPPLSPTGAPPTCAIQGCRYALYRPDETQTFGDCTSHREGTALVVTDALARHREQHLAIAH